MSIRITAKGPGGREYAPSLGYIHLNKRGITRREKKLLINKLFLRHPGMAFFKLDMEFVESSKDAIGRFYKKSIPMETMGA